MPSRRLLLAAGGLVLLAGCDAAPAPRPAAVAKPSRSPSGKPSHSPATPAAAISHDVTPARHQPQASTVAAGQPLSHVQYGPGGISLTIDDGPSPVYTPQILDLLHRYQVTASFSMIGVNVVAYPRLAGEVAAAGHMIVNHTWQHPNLKYLAPAAIADQLNRATGAIQAATGAPPRMFRAPYGAWSPEVLRQCARAGLPALGWSVDPRDWSRPGTAAIIRNILRNTKSGSIILEHDGGGDRSQTVAALRVLVPRLLAEGFTFFPP